MQDVEFATYPSLKGTPVLVSGGATGIGEALVVAFALQGAKVGFVDIASEPAKALEDKLNSAGSTVSFIECDVTDTEAYRAAIAAFAEKHGPAQVLVNNAAFDERHEWDKVTPESWDKLIAVNIKHFFFAIQACAPAMIAAGKGSIVNFGSIAWMIKAENLPVYESAKAAAHGLTRSLSHTLGRHGVRINTVVPGWIMTERQLKLWVGPKEEELIDANQALKGRVYPVDVANMALFLGADDSRMISAQQFVVDGGWANA